MPLVRRLCSPLETEEDGLKLAFWVQVGSFSAPRSACTPCPTPSSPLSTTGGSCLLDRTGIVDEAVRAMHHHYWLPVSPLSPFHLSPVPKSAILQAAFDTFARGNYPYSSSFVMGSRPGSLPPLPMKAACQHLSTSQNLTKDELSKVLIAPGDSYPCVGSVCTIGTEMLYREIFWFQIGYSALCPSINRA